MTLLLTTAAVMLSSTSYCLQGTMADGTPVRPGSVANNEYPLGTQLWISPSPTGQRHFVVRDRIGWGTQLDFWTPTCGRALNWGRRLVAVRRWPRPHLRGRVHHGRRFGRGVVTLWPRPPYRAL